jgi:hypothetical protein
VGSSAAVREKTGDRVDMTGFLPSSPAVTCNKKKKTQAVDFILFCPDCSCIFFLFRSVNFRLLSSSQLAVLSFFSRWQVWRLGGGGGTDDLHSCWLPRRLGLLLKEEGAAARGEGVVAGPSLRSRVRE